MLLEDLALASHPVVALTSAAEVGDPEATRTVYTTIVILALLGVALAALAIWVFRRTRPEPELLAPLETMETRGWRKLDPAAQRRLLDDARPQGASPLRREASAPSVDSSFATVAPVASFDDLTDGVADASSDAPADLPAPHAADAADTSLIAPHDTVEIQRSSARDDDDDSGSTETGADDTGELAGSSDLGAEIESTDAAAGEVHTSDAHVDSEEANDGDDPADGGIADDDPSDDEPSDDEQPVAAELDEADEVDGGGVDQDEPDPDQPDPDQPDPEEPDPDEADDDGPDGGDTDIDDDEMFDEPVGRSIDPLLAPPRPSTHRSS